jgi:hypothetical protein
MMRERKAAADIILPTQPGDTAMKSMLSIAGLALLLSVADPARAYYCEDGQLPAPPDVAARMALPLCGFAATKRWGANGCQLCDPRNMHPNPYGDDYRPPRRAHAYRGQ